jgi:prohibitin 2
MDSFFKKVIALAVVVMVVITVLITVTTMYKTVPAGYAGVVTEWGNPVRVTGSGMQMISPIVEDIEFVNVQVQSAEATESAGSSDLQSVSSTVTVNYKVDALYAKDVYTNLRNEYEGRVIVPAMKDALKASTAKFQASELITKREIVMQMYKDLLQAKLDQYHIIITSVMITDFKFSDNFMAAIELKVTAEQNALAAQNQLKVTEYQAQTQVIQASANATATINQAMGSANATLINANATATAIQMINSQLTPEYINYYNLLSFYAKWTGEYPTTLILSGGNGTVPLILVPTSENKP